VIIIERVPDGQTSFGVSAYSFPCSCGFAQRGDRTPLKEPLTAWTLIDLATEHELTSVEMPLSGMLPDLESGTIDLLRATLAERNLALVVDTGVIDPAALREILPLAARAGARIVRATLSTILEGARAQLAGGWQAHVEEMRRRISAVRPLLEAHDLVLAIENHQDATSDDLLMLCEAGGDHVGVTLDVVNPLAVGEEPLAFARKVGPWIRNVHLKDYQVYATPSGYRLARCALGQGVISFADLLPLLRKVAPDAPQHIELAALHARHVRLLEDDWWQGYPPRDARDLVPALRLMARHAQPDTGAWQTPWEHGAPPEEVQRYEHDQFAQSVRFLGALSEVQDAASRPTM
jgi:sugar phosphate isomerase/epimerase